MCTYISCDTGAFAGESGFTAAGFWRATDTMDTINTESKIKQT